MKIYSHYGYNDFIIALGYKGYVIKEYFANYFLHNSDIFIDLSKNKIEILNSNSENWKVTLVDTGLNTQTGGRIKRLEKYIGNETFMLTYGDGVSDININDLVEFHKRHKKYATVTAVQPAGKYGQLNIGNNNEVIKFVEKPPGDNAWINGGFFVLEPKIFDYISSDETIWEKEPIENLSSEGQLMAYKHYGFWKCMDTLRDKRELEELWVKGKAPWRLW
jgi:glucose-1-phosphate cytidylyltransferase